MKRWVRKILVRAAVSLAAVALPGLVSFAQPGGKPPRLCFLTFDPPAMRETRYAPFFVRMAELGYVEGRNIVVDYLSADGQNEAFLHLAGECVARQAAVIVATTTPAAAAAKRATAVIPIVVQASGDPVGTGLVTNLARPEGNVTGTTFMSPLNSAKRLELLKETVPGLSRVLAFAHFQDPIAARQVEAMEEVARALRIDLIVRDIRGPEDIAAAFDEGVRLGAEGFIPTTETIFVVHRDRLVELARAHALPAIYHNSVFSRGGGLMSYGPDPAGLRARTADQVDRLLKGARPGDLPVEQPAVFQLIINLKTAHALRLDIPNSILVRADEVIE